MLHANMFMSMYCAVQAACLLQEAEALLPVE